MKEIHYRIIDLPNHQVLFTKDWKDWDANVESTPLLLMEFFLDGIKVSQKMAYSNEDTRDKVFNELTNDKVQSIIDDILKMIVDD